MSTVEELDIHAVIAASLSEFFERILSMKMEVHEGDLLAVLEGEGFVSAVELAGELAGRFEIKMGSDFAVLMAASMLGGTVEDVDAEHEVLDLLGEMADFLGRKLKENCGHAGIGCEISKTEITTKDDLLASSAPLQRGSRYAFRYQGNEGWVDFRLSVGEAQQAPESNAPEGGENSKGEAGPSAASEPPDSVKSEKGASVLVSDGDQEISLELEPLNEDTQEEEDVGGFEGLSDDEEDASDLLSDITDPGGETAEVVEKGVGQMQNRLPEDGDQSPAGSVGEGKGSSGGKAPEAGVSGDDQFEGLSDDDENLSDIPGQADSPTDGGSDKRSGGKKRTSQKPLPDSGKHETLDPELSVKTLQGLGDNDRQPRGGAGAVAAGDLQEPEDGETENPDSPRKHNRRGLFWVAAAVLAAVSVGGWLFMLHRQSGPPSQPLATVEPEKEKPLPTPVARPDTEDDRKRPLAKGPPTAEARLSRKLADAQNLKETLLGKLEEVLRLKQYFRDGIADVRSQVAARVQNNAIRTYRQAIQDRRIELDLRTIQRRLAAVDQLNQPVSWLARAAEEIDYGIRKTRIDLTMAPYTAGVDLMRLQTALEDLTRQYALTDDRLLIDGQSVEARPLTVIWQEMNTPIKKVTWVQGAGGGVKGTFVNWAGSAANRKIWREICQGNYSHVSDLTMISSEAAACLAADRVKDLFLGGLAELPGAAARNLAKWPGSWLVLNGLAGISPAAARQLANWQGTCLSLNGLVELSPQAAGALSRWKGRQLEMVSLTAKGGKTSRSVLKPLKKWEARGRRLLVSPEVRKILDRL